jgi:hypothetical protein
MRKMQDQVLFEQIEAEILRRQQQRKLRIVESVDVACFHRISRRRKLAFRWRRLVAYSSLIWSDSVNRHRFVGLFLLLCFKDRVSGSRCR